MFYIQGKINKKPSEQSYGWSCTAVLSSRHISTTKRMKELKFELTWIQDNQDPHPLEVLYCERNKAYVRNFRHANRGLKYYSLSCKLPGFINIFTHADMLVGAIVLPWGLLNWTILEETGVVVKHQTDGSSRDSVTIYWKKDDKTKKALHKYISVLNQVREEIKKR